MLKTTLLYKSHSNIIKELFSPTVSLCCNHQFKFQISIFNH